MQGLHVSSNQSLVGGSAVDLKTQVISQVLSQSALLMPADPDELKAKIAINEVL